jgi:hypothetical protein
MTSRPDRPWISSRVAAGSCHFTVRVSSPACSVAIFRVTRIGLSATARAIIAHGCAAPRQDVSRTARPGSVVPGMPSRSRVAPPKRHVLRYACWRFPSAQFQGCSKRPDVVAGCAPRWRPDRRMSERTAVSNAVDIATGGKQANPHRYWSSAEGGEHGRSPYPGRAALIFRTI